MKSAKEATMAEITNSDFPKTDNQTNVDDVDDIKRILEKRKRAKEEQEAPRKKGKKEEDSKKGKGKAKFADKRKGMSSKHYID